MARTLYTGAAGLCASQYYINNVGNNLANVNTVGYKPVVTNFSDLMYSQMYIKSADLLSGNGSKAEYGGIDPTQSSLQPTGDNLNLAISGKGWFAVDTKNGVRYTRNGAFSLSPENGSVYLVDAMGDYVLDSTGNRISQAGAVDETETDTGDGTLTQTQLSKVDVEALTSRVAVVDFSNPEALTPLSSSLYASNAQSGNATLVTDPNVESGYLEQSGAQMVDGMISLIAAQRAFQLSSKVVQTADEDEQTVNSLRA